MGIKVDIADGDDWLGLYLDGKLVLQNHDLNLTEVLLLLNHEIVEFSEHFEVDLDWLDNIRHFPDNLEEVKRRKSL